jgi:predicted RNA methylase
MRSSLAIAIIVLSVGGILHSQDQQPIDQSVKGTTDRAIQVYANSLEQQNAQLQQAIKILTEEVASEKAIAGLDSFCVKYKIPIKRTEDRKLVQVKDKK